MFVCCLRDFTCMMVSRSTHVATDGIILFFLMAEWYSIVYIYWSINSCVD